MLTRRCALNLGAVAALCVGAAVFAGPPSQAADPPLEVVTSFSILGDMVKTVGGDGVQVITLVGLDGDAHVFEPTPADARAIADAKVVFINGLGLEQGWMPRLIEAAGYKGSVVVTSKGIKPLRMEEEEDEYGKEEASAHERRYGKPHMVDDPHAWQNLANGKIYAENIVAGLSAADPAGVETYRANGQAYSTEIDQLDAEVRAKLAAIPQARRKIVTTHDAFQYFGEAWPPRG